MDIGSNVGCCYQNWSNLSLLEPVMYESLCGSYHVLRDLTQATKHAADNQLIIWYII